MPPSRISPLLQPYTRLPAESSLYLLTSVLSASTNWLAVRFLCGALAETNAGSSRRRNGGAEDAGTGGLSNDASRTTEQNEEKDVAVVLVSWMRDWEFWRSESRRAGGLDLARLAQQNRFAFVDGLTGLFTPTVAGQTSSQAPPSIPAAHAPTTQPLRQSPLPTRPGRTITPRTPDVPSRQPAAASPRDPASASTHPNTTLPTQPQGLYHLTSLHLPHLEQVISSAISHVTHPSPGGNSSPKRILLILDAPDLLLAAADPSSGITATSLSASILKLRQRLHATVLAVAADSPLVSPSASASALSSSSSSSAFPASPRTPLETHHASFVIGQAHLADVVMSCRLLDTGFAADVSGVLRITLGDVGEEDEGVEGEGRALGEKEVLYFVGGDGGVRVFERGAGGGGG